MTTTTLDHAPAGTRGWILTAVRVRVVLVLLLMGLAGVAWWWAARQMRGMDGGPWTGLGGFAWFVSVWLVMMAAMMFPSVAPTVALYSKMTARRSPLAPLAFAAGYLLSWTVAGIGAYLVGRAGGSVAGGALAWNRGGRWVAAAALGAAAVYELTPLKEACLSRCRGPFGALLGSWRGGLRGALSMGTKNGGWCVGCCWALMLALFALGIMSVIWMAVISALIAIEKLLPWQRVATWATVAILVALAVLVAAVPHVLPGLMIPTSATNMEMR